MQPRSCAAIFLAAALIGPAAAMGQTATETPTPETIVRRAIDAAGGWRAFSSLGIVLADVTTEEVAQDGTQTKSSSKTFFQAPGPIPGRIELSSPLVISGDNGLGGWAVVAGKADPRPSTELMIRRLLRTSLFPLLLPFSLNWEDVGVTEVAATRLGDVPVWRLSVTLAPTFFHTPQIGTTWTIDINQKSYAVVQAQSPATDLGRGIKADGMSITWGKPQIVRGLTLPGEQRIVGLSETGAEKAHNRIDHVRYELIDSAKSAALFENPVPPNLRPTPNLGPQAVRPVKP